MGPRAVLNAVVKRKIPSPRRESNPRTPIVLSLSLSLYIYIYKTYVVGFIDCLSKASEVMNIYDMRFHNDWSFCPSPENSSV
jgi:hypothetical protein